MMGRGAHEFGESEGSGTVHGGDPRLHPADHRGRPGQRARRPAADPVRPAAGAGGLDHEDVSFREAGNQVDFAAVPVDDGPEEPEAFEPPPPIRPAPAAAPAPASEPLLSNVANATVAGAFQKLSTTVLTSNPRTLEDLVQDMLRPMLKGWLDENLPPLVERLVRQEIERITRAGR